MVSTSIPWSCLKEDAPEQLSGLLEQPLVTSAAPKRLQRERWTSVCLHCWSKCLCHDILHLLRFDFPIILCKLRFLSWTPSSSHPTNSSCISHLFQFIINFSTKMTNFGKKCFIRLWGEFFKEFENRTFWNLQPVFKAVCSFYPHCEGRMRMSWPLMEWVPPLSPSIMLCGSG